MSDILIVTDGAAKVDYDRSCWYAIVAKKKDGRPVYKECRFLGYGFGSHGSYFAELYGVCAALMWARQNKADGAHVVCDHETIVKKINEHKHPILCAHFNDYFRFAISTKKAIGATLEHSRGGAVAEAHCLINKKFKEVQIAAIREKWINVPRLTQKLFPEEGATR